MAKLQSPKQQSLSLAQARRLALAAQNFGSGAGGVRGIRTLGTTVGKLGLLQIDSVNVLVRSHYLPLFSRFGGYEADLLDRAAYDGQRRVLFEYWGHEASLLPLALHPLLRWRMERAKRGEGTWASLRRYAKDHAVLIDAALKEIAARGPLGASELEGAGKSRAGWWEWSQGKKTLEWLFWTGVVTTARRRNFERLYDLTERVLPTEVVSAPTPPKDEAQRKLMTIAARALGVATLRDLRDYFRLPAEDASARLAELVEEGQLIPVSVEGWKQQAYLSREARLPRSVNATALLSPFDSLIWERQRTERLFGFSYRLEIYTPAHKRQHGYYVLPFLLGDRLVARLDLKSDRQRGCLQVRGGSVEKGIAAETVAEPLAAQLQLLAQWLRLEQVEIASRRGELMARLRWQMSGAK